MRVAVYYNNRDVRFEEMEKPGISDDEILVKVMSSGICGTDVLEWYRIKKAPRVMGHEIAGDIVEVGKNINKYKIGDRVFVSHHVPCGKCSLCLNNHETACNTLHNTNYFPGGFSEYIRVPKINVENGVFVLPDELSYDEGAFVEPLACVARGQRLAGFKEGVKVLVLGSGISGLLHIMLARANKASKIVATDVCDYRLNAAKSLGADEVIDVRKDAPEVRADLVIVCTGAYQAFMQALQCVDKGGTILFFATTQPGATVPIPVDKFWRNEVKIMTSYANSPEDALEAIKLIKSGRVPVKKLVTHRLGLDEIQEGFRLVSEAKESIKIIIKPHKNK